jgi:hypothetical protein
MAPFDELPISTSCARLGLNARRRDTWMSEAILFLTSELQMLRIRSGLIFSRGRVGRIAVELAAG